MNHKCYLKWTHKLYPKLVHKRYSNGSKYLVIESIDENKEVLKKCTELWNLIKNKNETMNGGKKGEYDKDFMKIEFHTDYNLPLNKQLKLHMLTIIVRSVFEEHGKFYLHLYSDVSWYELKTCCNTKKLMFPNELTLIIQVHQKIYDLSLLVFERCWIQISITCL